MARFVIDNCKRCAASTTTDYKDLQRMIADIEKGDIGCWLCDEDGEHHTEFDIFDRDKRVKVWCGHTPKCEDVCVTA